MAVVLHKLSIATMTISTEERDFFVVPKTQQRFVSQMLDTVLTQAQR